MADAPEFRHGDLGSYADIYKLYEDGKKRRYDLLFAVNAGVFAVINGVKAFGAAEIPGLQHNRVAFGMMLLTALFGYDIWQFGMRMRKKAQDGELPNGEGMFANAGRFVLCGICAVLIAGWSLAAFPRLLCGG